MSANPSTEHGMERLIEEAREILNRVLDANPGPLTDYASRVRILDLIVVRDKLDAVLADALSVCASDKERLDWLDSKGNVMPCQWFKRSGLRIPARDAIDKAMSGDTTGGKE